MRSRGVFLTVLVVAMSLVMALPASANKVDPRIGVAAIKAVGLLSGAMLIGKTGTCSNDGTGTVLGAGLGLPWPVNKAKNGWWMLSVSLFQATSTGGMQACGQLMPVGNVVMPSGRPDKPATKPGIGAACGMSKGHSGFGQISGMLEDVYLRNLGWKFSGITIIMSGDAVQASFFQDYTTKPSQDKVLAIVQATGLYGPCFAKRDNFNPKIGTGKKPSDFQGATFFQVVGAYTIRNATDADTDLNSYPIFCKRTGDPYCGWATKK